MQTSSLRARLLELFARHRRRLATLVLGLFLVAVALEIGGSLPRETQVSVPLGPAHAEVTEARIDVEQDDEMVQSLTLRWRSGAPAAVRHTLDLSPGDYDVSVRLLERGGRERRLTGRLTAPADGVVRLALEES